MCEWRSSYLGSDYHCKVPVEPRSKYCIFHEPGSKDVERFANKFYEQIEKEGPRDQRNPQYDFTGYVFPGVGVRAGKSEEADNALILPQEIRGNLLFIEATIDGDAYFSDAKVKGDVDFSDATVNGDVSFSRAEIRGSVNFGGGRIKEMALFLDTMIMGDTSFNHARIGWSVVFERAMIEGHAFFNGVKIGRTADFCEAVFLKAAFFDRAEIGNVVSFRGATISGTLYFQGATVQNWGNFQAQGFRGDVLLDLSVFGGIVKFEGTTFSKATTFYLCEARGLELGEGKPTIAWWVPGRQGVVLKDVHTGYRFWEFARRTHERGGNREKADAAYYFERVWRRKAAMASTARQRLFAILSYPFDVLFLRLPIAYGTSIFRTLASWIVVILAFCFVYATIPSLLVQSAEELWTRSNWVTSLYFSITSFTTLGLGDIQPARLLGKVLISLEAVLGGLLMALTVVVISRKFMR